MFPVVEVMALHLDADQCYTIGLDLVDETRCVYGYREHGRAQTPIHHGGDGWFVKKEPSEPYPLPEISSVHVHPDSPQSGQVWMGRGIRLDAFKIRSRNNRHSACWKESSSQQENGFLGILPGHRYRVRIHLVQWSGPCGPKIWTFHFDELTFYASNNYRNPELATLKVDHSSGELMKFGGRFIVDAVHKDYVQQA